MAQSSDETNPAAPQPPARDGLREAAEAMVGKLHPTMLEYAAEHPDDVMVPIPAREVLALRVALAAGQAGEEVGAFWCNYCPVRFSRFTDLETHLPACRARAEALQAADETFVEIARECSRLVPQDLVDSYMDRKLSRIQELAHAALAKLRAGLGEGGSEHAADCAVQTAYHDEDGRVLIGSHCACGLLQRQARSAALGEGVGSG